jgi:hypothetical protein
MTHNIAMPWMNDTAICNLHFSHVVSPQKTGKVKSFYLASLFKKGEIS